MAESKLVSTPFDALTYKIIGCAMAIHRELGPGFRENTYQRALENSLHQASIRFQSQRLYEVYAPDNSNVLIGYYIPDFVVEDKVVIEIKALRGMDKSHEAQIIGYLAVTHCPIGLLLNFGERSLGKQRIFPPKDIANHYSINHQWLFVPDWLKPDTESS